jgi:hypothetical protein
LTDGKERSEIKFMGLRIGKIPGTDITYHEDTNPGLVTGGVVVEEINNAHGQHYWKATARIGSIFGAEVEGELTGMGPTKEQALERLKEEREKLYESLWA